MIRTYDPALVVATWLGIPISGYADGTFIECERQTDTYSSQAGSGGEVARVRSRDRRGTITFTLMQSSPVNDLLSAALKSDELLGNGVGPFMCKDLNGTTLVMGSNAWGKKPPKVEFGKELGTRVWTLECEVLNETVGGNTLTIGTEL